MKAKSFLKRLGIMLCVILFAAAALFGAWKLFFDPYRGTVEDFTPSRDLSQTISAGEATADLDYIADRLLERHPACMNGLPEKVEAAYRQERDALASKGEVTVLALWQSAARILHALGDAHTQVRAFYDDAAVLPLSFAYDYDAKALYVADGEYAGYFVDAIGGIGSGELYTRFCSLFSYELEAYAAHSFANRVNRADYLAFLGVDTSGTVRVSLSGGPDGVRVEMPLEPQAAQVSAQQAEESFVSYEMNEADGYAVLTLRECDYNETYKNTLLDFFTRVRDEQIQNVIVDLRGNSGGNSMVANEFIRYLPAENYKTSGSNVRCGPFLIKNNPSATANRRYEDLTFSGNVYMLTVVSTFSSAMDFALYLSDNGLAKIIGEVPGNMPSSYGDILRFQTPNARLAFTVSYKYFTRPDLSKTDLPLVPDVGVPASSAMDTALRIIVR